eukprot:TRINITY_DN8653_c0_g1_i2.p1 TRINITY_DN8653_c0_g1~~TRINITY_DN8653_c0_g1_i2.p1  ORF type:complete len:254 (+),score=50.59 TRINITY_DN8653_c0_g1_i2:68-763(+)
MLVLYEGKLWFARPNGTTCYLFENRDECLAPGKVKVIPGKVLTASSALVVPVRTKVPLIQMPVVASSASAAPPERKFWVDFSQLNGLNLYTATLDYGAYKKSIRKSELILPAGMSPPEKEEVEVFDLPKLFKNLHESRPSDFEKFGQQKSGWKVEPGTFMLLVFGKTRFDRKRKPLHILPVVATECIAWIFNASLSRLKIRWLNNNQVHTLPPVSGYEGIHVAAPFERLVI